MMTNPFVYRANPNSNYLTDRERNFPISFSFGKEDITLIKHLSVDMAEDFARSILKVVAEYREAAAAHGAEPT